MEGLMNPEEIVITVFAVCVGIWATFATIAYIRHLRRIPATVGAKTLLATIAATIWVIIITVITVFLTMVHC